MNKRDMQSHLSVLEHFENNLLISYPRMRGGNAKTRKEATYDYYTTAESIKAYMDGRPELKELLEPED